MTNGEDERERKNERERRGEMAVCALIDPWSERLCPLICRAGGKGFGLRCFRMSLFGVQDCCPFPPGAVSSSDSLRLTAAVSCCSRYAHCTTKAKGQSMRYKRLIQILLVNE